MKTKNYFFLFFLFSNFIFSCFDSSSNLEEPFFKNPAIDYKVAIQEAKKSGKPIMIYFSGFGVINARKMEDTHFLNSSIQKFCSEEIEVITLHVDDRTKLKTPFILEFGNQKKMIKTIGSKNSHFQLQAFEYGTQPQLVFIDSEEKKLISIGFTSNLNELKEFLYKGKKLFEEQKALK